MTLSNTTKINQLVSSKYSRGVFFSEWLVSNGYSNQLIADYRKGGWLETVCRGVMKRPGTVLSALVVVGCYNEQISHSIRVAAHSALELAGYNHYVPMGKPTLMVAQHDKKMNAWTKFDGYDANIKVFSSNMFHTDNLVEYNREGITVSASSPEQAFMECLLHAPSQYAYMDLYYIMEQMTSLRADVVQLLLEECKNNRVKRLFLYMAEKAGHYWFDMLDIPKVDIGSGKLQLADGGVYIPKYKITIPKELQEYE